MKLSLESLLEEGRALPDDQLPCPFQDRHITEGETVIGTVDHDLKIFPIKAQALREKIATKVSAHTKFHEEGSAHDRETCIAFHKEISMLDGQSDYLMSIFWDELHRSIPDGDKIGVMAVRADWQVVSTPESEEGSNFSGIIVVSEMPS